MLSLEYTFRRDQFREDIELTDADKPRLTRDSLVLRVIFLKTVFILPTLLSLHCCYWGDFKMALVPFLLFLLPLAFGADSPNIVIVLTDDQVSEEHDDDDDDDQVSHDHNDDDFAIIW